MCALNYFKNEADDLGFLFWINSFVLSMVILILSDNFFTLFLGWELIGLTSFFLINFWNSRRATLKSSFKALSFNLVSDLSLLAAFIILYNIFNTSNISELNSQFLVIALVDNNSLIWAGLLIILCASIKSVQFIGHLWLPDSMEAPVPASALIHSATLVSAGIFLLLRFKDLFFLTNLEELIILLGSFTAAYGGVVSASQTDVKKLLAYSTMSHCGFLFSLSGFGDTKITIVYLILHGLFKAGTFFCVGSFIRIYGTQDTRLMGNSAQFYWGDSILLLLCASNLAGLPLTIGLMYKAFFFKILFTSKLSIFSSGFFFLALLMGVVYFFRLTYYIIFDNLKMVWTAYPFVYEALNNRDLKDPRISFYRKHHWESRLATLSNWTVVALLLIAAFYFYRTINFYELTNIRSGEFCSTTSLTTEHLYIYYNYFYRFYLIYFYIIYLIMILLISFLTWRKNLYFYNKLYLWIYVLIFLLYFIIRCEVLFWLKRILLQTLTMDSQTINPIF